MTSQIRLGAIFWLLTIELFVAQFVAQAAWPSYSMLTMDISNLGQTGCDGTALDATNPDCSPLNRLFNAGMVLNGVLIVLGVWFTRTLWPQGQLATTALWTLAVGGGDGSILVGLIPINLSLPLHATGAVLALFVACFGILMMGIVVWRTNRAFALYSFATGLITLIAFCLYALEIYLDLGQGIMERIAAWPHTVWYMVTGALILRGHFRTSAA